MTHTRRPADASDLTPLPALPLGLYEHHKGGRYEVLGVARHSETHEPLVVYRPLYGEGAMWVRPFAMFTETAWVNGAPTPRFKWLGARADAAPVAPR